MDKDIGYFNFESLDVWNNAVELTTLIYKLTKDFPKSELFALTDQLKRAVSSIALNIAEGYGYDSYKEKLKFLSHAKGSLYEVYTCLTISDNLGYLKIMNINDILSKVKVIHRQLNGLIKFNKESLTKF